MAVSCSLTVPLQHPRPRQSHIRPMTSRRGRRADSQLRCNFRLVQVLGFQHDLHLRDLDTYTRAPTCTITDADIGIDIDALGVYSWCLL